MRLHFKLKFIYVLYCGILLSTFAFINQTSAAQLADGILTEEIKEGTRLIISTTGAAKFISYWLDGPPRLAIEFQSRNIISKIDKEVIVDQGAIRRITSSYFGRGGKHSLKSLTFELTQKVPYKIWQENNTILLEIQAPLAIPTFSVEGEKVFTESEAGDEIIKRVEAMDAALMQVAETHLPLKAKPLAGDISSLGPPKIEQDLDEGALTEYFKKMQAEREAFSPKTEALPVQKPAIEKKATVTILFGLILGSALTLGLGLFVWHRRKLNIAKEFEKVKSKLEEKDRLLEEKDKRIEHEKIVRKAVEETSLQREKEYQQLKDSLIKRGFLKRQLLPEEKEKPWISGKSPERRQFSRLALSRDYSRTIILRIESQTIPESIKSFANNISSDGLCFETTREFQEKEPINLRLFFYGDIVPMVKIQAHITRKKEVEPINYYGVHFDMIEENNRLELNRYIESKSETAIGQA